MSNNIIKPQVRVPEVILPSDIIEQKYSGEIKGYFVENSNTYNILPIDQNANIDQNRIMQVGYILPYNPITTLFGIDDNIILTQFKFLKLKDVDQKDMLSVLTNSMAKPTDNSEIKHISIGDTKQIESDCINLLMQTKYNNDPQHQDLTWIENSMFIYNLCLSEDDFNSICKSNINNNLVGYWEDDSLHFLQLSTRMECKQQPYTLKLDVFSRNTGILESDIMMNKAAVFIGCGSVGSLFALELAKAGVSKFLLIDNDIFGYHNICRHQCGIYDVGRFKTDALRERILEINPYANVVTQNTTIQAMPVDELVAFCDNNTIVIGGADNREGDLYANNIAKQVGMPFMSIGCWERAFAGEIFYCLPEGMPDYKDFMDVSGALSSRVNQNRRFYTTEEELAKISFEPGISVDIDFVTIIAVKLALDILNINNENYTQRVLPHLTQYTLVCNTNNTKIGGEMAEIFSYPLQVTTSIVIPYSKE